jgi:hypothetical protein
MLSKKQFESFEVARRKARKQFHLHSLPLLTGFWRLRLQLFLGVSFSARGGNSSPAKTVWSTDD